MNDRPPIGSSVVSTTYVPAGCSPSTPGSTKGCRKLTALRVTRSVTTEYLPAGSLQVTPSGDQRVGPPPWQLPVAASTTATRELELPSFRERVDIALRLGLVDRVLRLNLLHQVVLVLERAYLFSGELAPPLLDLASHAVGVSLRRGGVRLRVV